MRRPALPSCLALASCLALLSGCGGASTVPPVIALTPADFGHTVDMHIGQAAELHVSSGVGYGVECVMTPEYVLSFAAGPLSPSGEVLLTWKSVATGRAEVAVRRYVLGPPPRAPEETVGSFKVAVGG